MIKKRLAFDRYLRVGATENMLPEFWSLVGCSEVVIMGIPNDESKSSDGPNVRP
jgi:hypothetical protein